MSYDPTRELYQDYNAEFINFWKKDHAGDNVKISNPTVVRANKAGR